MEEAYATMREIARKGIMASIDKDEIPGIGSGLATNASKSPNKREDKSHHKCAYCGGSWHTKEGCFKIVGYPDWWPDEN